jgi:hypothetical protein
MNNLEKTMNQWKDEGKLDLKIDNHLLGFKDDIDYLWVEESIDKTLYITIFICSIIMLLDLLI